MTYININRALTDLTHYFESQHVTSNPESLYEPRNYIMGLNGKKMRALLCLMGYSLYDSDYTSVIPMAYSIELFHSFTLLHDDIMDQAELRRGQQTAHLKYGSNMALLAGDVMLIEVYDRLVKDGGDHAMSYWKVLNKVARLVCEGQAMDMSFETSAVVTLTDYLQMIEWKTAVLLGLSLQYGAIAAGASASDQNHLYHFGVYAGIGFQLQDDLLDIYGDPKLFGKKIGGDIRQSKKTYFYIKALELLEGADRENFIEMYNKQVPPSINKVEMVTQVFDQLFIKNYCEEAKSAFFDLAISHLNQVHADEDKKSQLIQFSRSLLYRNK